MDDLDRVYHRVLHNIRARFPEYLTVPLTVAQLYEQVIPYRHYRRELGIETNQDYEIALTRLLSGERDYVKSDPAMQQRLREELKSRNPDSGAFRDYGATQIWINADMEDTDSTATVSTSAPTAAAASGAAAASVPTAAPAAPRVSSSRATTTKTTCQYCGGTLPEGRQVSFCPHCGQNLAAVHCPACGTELDPSWKFCVNCGRKTGV
jgi:hypothetical protein